MVAGRSNPTPEARAANGRSNPMSKEQWLPGSRRAERSYSTFNVRKDGFEEIPLIQGKVQRLCFAGEIPHIQGKEQRLRFAGAAMKRNPTSKVRETQVRR